MLNLNAMFSSYESIFDQPIRTRRVSSTELQLMEMEIAADLANADRDTAKASATVFQLDQLFNIYNHVRQFGIDRTFLSLYNSNNQLNSMLGMRFPSCESMDSEGYPGSNVSRAFLAAMEDENEGIFAKIIKSLKWIWEKIKHFCTVVWTKIKSWLGFSTKRNENILAKVGNTVRHGVKFKSFKRIISKHKEAVIITAVLAIVTAAQIYGNHKKITAMREETERYKKEVEENIERGKRETEERIEKFEELRKAVAGNSSNESAETIENPTKEQILDTIDSTQKVNKKVADGAEKINNVISEETKQLNQEIAYLKALNAKDESYRRQLKECQERLAGYRKIAQDLMSIQNLTNEQVTRLNIASQGIAMEEKKEKYLTDQIANTHEQIMNHHKNKLDEFGKKF